MTGEKLTSADMSRGYVVCKCGKYAHVFSADLLACIHGTEIGETCKECGAYMMPVDKAKAASITEKEGGR